MKTIVGSVGGFLSEAAEGTGYSLALLARTLWHFPTLVQGRQAREVLHQMFVCGIASLPVTMVVSVFTGAILALMLR